MLKMKKHFQLRKIVSLKENKNIINNNNVEILKLRMWKLKPHSQAFKVFTFFFSNQLVLKLKLFKPPSEFSEFFARKSKSRDGLP